MLIAIRIPNRLGPEYLIGVNSKGQIRTTIFVTLARKFSSMGDLACFAADCGVTKYQAEEVTSRVKAEAEAKALEAAK